MKKNLVTLGIPGALLLIFLHGCAPSRAVLDGPEVAPSGQLMGRVDMGLTIPTVAIGAVADDYDLAKSWVKSAIKQDSIIDIPDTTYIRKASKTLLAMSLDPFAPTMEFGVAYGLPGHVEVLASGIAGGWKAGARWQVKQSDLKITLGATYGSESYELPSMLSKAQDLLGYTFERTDITIPVVMGKTSGNPDGFRTEWGVGLQYQRSKMQYGFSDDSKLMLATWIIDGVSQEPGSADRLYQSIPQAHVICHSLGGMANLRIGYKYANLVLGFGAYYQNYGSYTLMDGDTVNLKGMAFVPRIGIEFRHF